MSASREKKNRQELMDSDWVDPKIAEEAEQHKNEKRTNTIYMLIGILFLIAVVITVVWRSNIIAKMATAATIDGEKYTAAEVDFFYENILSGTVSSGYYYYYGFDPSASLKDQTVSESAASMLGIEAGQTWHEYFLSTSLEQMAAVQNALKQAQEEGFVYPASVQEQVAANMAILENGAAASGISAAQLLKDSFGSTMTVKVYEEQLERMAQYQAYATAYNDNLTYTDSEINDAYNANPNYYDAVSCECVYITGEAESSTDADGNPVDPTEEEIAAAKKAAKDAADQLLADYRAGGDLESLAKDVGSYSKLDNSAYGGDVVTEWLFDDARKAKDSAVLESGSSYYVVVFHDRTREDYNTVSVRHVLLKLDESTLDAESETYEADLQALKDATYAEAEELLAQWKSGEATEESFAQMANEYSADGGSNTTGGLYSGFAKGQMVPEFNDWCFDPARKSGDTGIVYGESTSYKGYHLVYFVSTDAPYWEFLVDYDLKAEDFADWQNSLADGSNIQRNDLGLKFVDS